MAKLDAELEARHAKELQQLDAAEANGSSSEAGAAAAAQSVAAADGSVDEADKASKYLKDLSIGDAEAVDEPKAGKVGETHHWCIIT